VAPGPVCSCRARPLVEHAPARTFSPTAATAHAGGSGTSYSCPTQDGRAATGGARDGVCGGGRYAVGRVWSTQCPELERSILASCSYTASEMLAKPKAETRMAGTTVTGFSEPREGSRRAAVISSTFLKTATGLSFHRKLLTG
jgi:hypothetical protein